MPEAKYRIEMITPWTGKIDGEERKVKAGEQVDVDMTTCRALVFQYDKAKLVTAEEIIEQAKTPVKMKPGGQRASRTKGKKKPDKNKMQQQATVKK